MVELSKLYSLSMNKKIFNKFQVKDKVAKAELTRAHGIIILLSLSLMALLALSSNIDLALDPVLSFIAVLLLAIVVLFSLSIIVAVKKGK